MSCDACENPGKRKIVYEDEIVVAFLDDKPVNHGHIIVMPKKHYTIMEQVPDLELAHMSIVANKISIALFETMKIQGTNVIIQNGIAAGQSVPHFMLHIIPRVENDGINFMWQPKQLSEEEMSTIELKLNENNGGIGTFEKEKPKEDPVSVDKKREQIKNSKEENYLIKQLERIP